MYVSVRMLFGYFIFLDVIVLYSVVRFVFGSKWDGDFIELCVMSYLMKK